MAAAHLGHGGEEAADAVVGLHEIVRVHADVELCQMETEQLDTSAERTEGAVGDARTAVGAKASAEQRQIVGQAVGGLVGVGVESPPHEGQLSPVRLVEILVPDRLCIVGKLALVACDRLEQFFVDRRELRGHADLGCERAHLVAVAVTQKCPRAFERQVDRVGARIRVAVGVAPDPRAEAERRPRIGKVPAVVREEPLRGIDQALLEEPVAVADLVDDPRASRANLVRLPERRDLRREPQLDLLAPRRREQWVVELGKECSQAEVRCEHRPSRRLGGVSRQHELEGDAVLDVAASHACERLGQRLGQHAVLGRVGAAPPDPVLLLGRVGELEVEGERTQDAGLPLERKLCDRGGQIVVAGAGPGGPRERAHALDVFEQRLVLLLHEHPPQQAAEQADVAPQRGVGGGVLYGHAVKRRPKSPKNRTKGYPGAGTRASVEAWG